MEPGAFSPTLLASRHARNTPPRSKMLPGSSCCMVEFLPQDRLLVGCERAADLRQHLGRRDRLRPPVGVGCQVLEALTDRKSTRLNSSHVEISYAVFCLKKKK